MASVFEELRHRQFCRNQMGDKSLHAYLESTSASNDGRSASFALCASPFNTFEIHVGGRGRNDRPVKAWNDCVGDILISMGSNKRAMVMRSTC